MSLLMEAETPAVLALVDGKPLTKLPKDLFIPPDALEVFLDSFSGPLDLLLYLIRQHDIDILDIPIALITQQYMQYIDLIEKHRLELASDYLLMAAMLAEIKSKLLLPSPERDDEQEEEDPRLVLVKKLQAYEQMKHASLLLDALPHCERDVFSVTLFSEKNELTREYQQVDLESIVDRMRDIMERESHCVHYHIEREPLSVESRMNTILEKIVQKGSMSFEQLLERAEGRKGLGVTLLAILQLARESLLLITQLGPFQPIYVEGRSQ